MILNSRNALAMVKNLSTEQRNSLIMPPVEKRAKKQKVASILEFGMQVNFQILAEVGIHVINA